MSGCDDDATGACAAGVRQGPSCASRASILEGATDCGDWVSRFVGAEAADVLFRSLRLAASSGRCSLSGILSYAAAVVEREERWAEATTRTPPLDGCADEEPTGATPVPVRGSSSRHNTVPFGGALPPPARSKLQVQLSRSQRNKRYRSAGEPKPGGCGFCQSTKHNRKACAQLRAVGEPVLGHFHDLLNTIKMKVPVVDAPVCQWMTLNDAERSKCCAVLAKRVAVNEKGDVVGMSVVCYMRSPGGGLPITQAGWMDAHSLLNIRGISKSAKTPVLTPYRTGMYFFGEGGD